MFSNTSAVVGRGWQARSKGSLQQMIPSDEPAPHQSSCAHTSTKENETESRTNVCLFILLPPESYSNKTKPVREI